MTAPMFAIDQAENDRLLLAEAERRRELINTALTSFAPHLLNHPDSKVVHLWSTNAALRKYVRTLWGESPRHVVVEHCRQEGQRRGVHSIPQDGMYLDLPPTADFVMTRSALNFKTELLAAHLRALPVVVPEAEDFLREALHRKGLLVIVGADQMKR